MVTLVDFWLVELRGCSWRHRCVPALRILVLRLRRSDFELLTAFLQLLDALFLRQFACIFHHGPALLVSQLCELADRGRESNPN